MLSRAVQRVAFSVQLRFKVINPILMFRDNLQSEQTVKLQSEQRVKLQSEQTVKLQSEQTVKLQSEQTVNLQSEHNQPTV